MLSSAPTATHTIDHPCLQPLASYSHNNGLPELVADADHLALAVVFITAIE
jgi:hypothetical protein